MGQTGLTQANPIKLVDKTEYQRHCERHRGSEGELRRQLGRKAPTKRTRRRQRSRDVRQMMWHFGLLTAFNLQSLWTLSIAYFYAIWNGLAQTGRSMEWHF
jgi:hypothetical protein